ncbi:MAG: hypothetical protein A2504_12990 [Bdellovibrionales bacterium RIFOXYD12_FULL_39_22]|nr:MAG: hypothetical protein A2385_00790 [Bdellovibrionales bacterium RIFOXYB1_FULL_39_21]OFZ43544.1 MAG: hypothetical protein A2485_12460 [Bdellovibrionales bacterium RIFOXYC12_FULL_39_17]OFZ44563.1 MAG: hypothetical protein A2404_10150 [Bdellovibrionales bacterium RIFOXYC1_FULL_39_130]OFZ76322.1 MAG: hypothetical protein A2560_06770 [Bdellovibrionales bacterium RIFOXYD1_FULL_39_84]OFZ94588.1 MAG: hypothetical protein A2504_12990 [Bdellovibrionales bacterium RIFOXYD12_FULL_39_22]HLE12958.1 al
MALIKLVKKAELKSPNLVFIPGGPGLGPNSFDLLSEKIVGVNVFYFYPTGTILEESGGRTPSVLSYDVQLADLVNEIKKIKAPILCGHSFGGIIATDLAVKSPELISGLICIASPFSKNSFDEVSKNFMAIQNEESETINNLFEKNPTNDLYKKWFAHYAELYFSHKNIKNGKKLLLNDSSCVKAYLDATEEASQKESLLAEIKSSSVRRIFIAGEEDRLLPPNVLEKDAASGDYKFISIEYAGHFAHFDQPDMVSEVIINFILTGGK